ncbi:Thiamine-monophosphate kinase [Candidatus Hepatincolaceae symbiont of Richtersius coronifer]
MNHKPLSEFTIINDYFYKLAKKKEALDLKDDAAVFNLPNQQTVITVDSIIEGRHFFPQDEPASVANKILGRNLSDLAAMGCKPKYWTLAINFPTNSSLNPQWLQCFCKSIAKLQKKYNFYLIGGDTTFSHAPLMLTVNAIGSLNNFDTPLKKSGAQIGDIICVSGFIGDSYWGLKILQKIYLPKVDLDKEDKYNFLDNLSLKAKDYLINKYKYIYPQVELGQLLLRYANACTDLSDGLWSDLEKLCKFSCKVGVIEINLLKFSPYVQAIFNKNLKYKKEFLIQSLTGGDDYQLAFTVPKEKIASLREAVKDRGIFIQEIGIIIKSNSLTKKNGSLEGALLIYAENHELLVSEKKGFDHSLG